MNLARLLSVAIFCALVSAATAQVGSAPAAAGPYKILNSVKPGGAGGFDYVYADADGRKLYIPRGTRVDVFDLDSLKPAGSISDAFGVHGAAVDPQSKHGFCSSNPVVMWDTDTLKTIKTIPVEGRPDGILFDPATQHVLILSHRAPNATVIDARDGSIVGTIDLGGAPEQGASDGQGRLYIDIEDKDNVAVVDAKTLKVTAHYALAGKGGAPAGLALDARNHLLFVCGRKPATCVVLNADDGTIITALPIGSGVDAAEFNPNTMEAFASTGDGKLTVIKETDPKTFVVEQTLPTMSRAKTSTLDLKTNRIFLIASDRTAAPAAPPAPAAAPGAASGAAPDAGARPRGGRGDQGGIFTILVAGREAAR